VYFVERSHLLISDIELVEVLLRGAKPLKYCNLMGSVVLGLVDLDVSETKLLENHYILSSLLPRFSHPSSYRNLIPFCEVTDCSAPILNEYL
jgi:hypothetical protein